MNLKSLSNERDFLLALRAEGCHYNNLFIYFVVDVHGFLGHVNEKLLLKMLTESEAPAPTPSEGRVLVGSAAKGVT